VDLDAAVIGIILGILYLNMDKSNKVFQDAAMCLLLRQHHQDICLFCTRHPGPAELVRHADSDSTCYMPFLQGIQDRNGLIFFILIGACTERGPCAVCGYRTLEA
jgi:hypothetical protein